MRVTNKNLFTTMYLIALTLGVIWIWYSRALPGNASENPELPKKSFSAPNFRLQSTTGDWIELIDLKNQPVILNYWASWCPPCRAEMPALQRVYQEYKDQGLVILAVNATNQDNLSQTITFIDEYKLTFPIVLDFYGEVANLYRIESLPTTYFINRNGIITDVVIGGPMAEALLRVRVDELIEVKQP